MSAGGSGLLGGLVAGTLLALGGWFCAFSIGKPLHERAAASTAWPVAEGRIMKSQLARSRDKGTTMYSADVAYEYTVDGRRFEGDAIWMGDGYRSSDAAEFRRAVDRYPVGRVVQVHYDPAAPDSSVLEPGATWSSGMLYFMGLGVLALGSVILLSTAVPLFILLAALGGSLAARSPDPAQDFDHLATPASARRNSASRPLDNDDDGITIG